MIAAASVSAATHGLMGHSWNDAERTSLLDRLHKITTIDVVSIFTIQHQTLFSVDVIFLHKSSKSYAEKFRPTRVVKYEAPKATSHFGPF